MTTEPTWNHLPGAILKRRDLHLQYGGRPQGRLSPSRTTPNTLLFTSSDPRDLDGWAPDGTYHLCGEGLSGDQTLTQSNGAVLRTLGDGHTGRLLTVTGRDEVQYVGAFSLAQDPPFYYAERPMPHADDLRQCVIFRLRPQDPASARAVLNRHVLSSPPSFDAEQPPVITDLEQRPATGETFFINEAELAGDRREPTTTERVGIQLLRQYRADMTALGHTFTRYAAQPSGEPRPVLTDLVNTGTRELILVSGTATRLALRETAGRFLDLGRFFPDLTRTLLLPSPPRPDLNHYLRSLNIQVTYPNPDGDGYLRP